ncbi:MAG: hypothetical protein P8Z80_06580 [Pseudolabrys sp.]
MRPDLAFLGEVEEVLLEGLALLAQALGDLLGQRTLDVQRPFQRRHHRDTEGAEQLHQVGGVGPDGGPLTRRELRQKEALDIDYDRATLVRLDAPYRRHVGRCLCPCPRHDPPHAMILAH